MPTSIMHPARRDDLLKRVDDRDKPSAKVDLNFLDLENGGRLLRAAYHRAGLTQQEAMHALGVTDPGYFNRMLDGKEKLWLHQLLRPKARAIWKQLIQVSANETPGMVVRCTIEITDGPSEQEG